MMYLVVGLGKTGQSCIRYLLAQGHQVIAADNRPWSESMTALQQTYPDLPIHADAIPDDYLGQSVTIVLSPGVPRSLPIIQRYLAAGANVIGDIELFARANKKPLIAITGTNGKSTVTQLVSELLTVCGYQVAMGGNIGVPALNLLEMTYDVAVLELSSYQLESTEQLNADIAVVLNVSPDHMDRYEDFSAYVQAKQTIYQQSKRALINLDQPACWHDAVFSEPPISFSMTQLADFQLIAEQTQLAKGDDIIFPVAELALQGQHNIENALAACALAMQFVADPTPFANVLARFTGLPHRCQLIESTDDRHWINDSKATNVGATVAALRSIQPSLDTKKMILLAGGVAKNQDFSPLFKPLKEVVTELVLFGEDAEKLADVLQGACPIYRCQNLAEAVSYARTVTGEGDVILLSPACSSLDQFTNFEQRGRCFTEYAQA